LAMATVGRATAQYGDGNGKGTGEPRPGQAGAGEMTLVEAAQLVERLQGRAAHERELEALRIARDALLVVVSEGFSTLRERLRPAEGPDRETEPVRALPGGSTVSFRAAFSPHR
jgi:hypothetical protein